MLAPGDYRDLCRLVMSSLSEILSSHKTLLLIDACSERVQVAIIHGKDDMHWSCAEEEAGTGIFSCVGKFGDRISTVDAFIFCEGPGSILGIRTSAAAIKVWHILNPKPVWAYRSLELLAHSVSDKRVSVISDARRDFWHVWPCRGISDAGAKYLTPSPPSHWTTNWRPSYPLYGTKTYFTLVKLPMPSCTRSHPMRRGHRKFIVLQREPFFTN
jgi:tRNA A37 threonylcarbamoyladenosine modification protein TsaB